MSSEKNDMNCPTRAIRTSRLEPAGGPETPLRCVWTNHPSHDRCCHELIPAIVVAAAWERERERGQAAGDRFFHFVWRGNVWLAYGLWNGSVRGVYCPAHSAARDARAIAPDESHPIALTA